MRQTLVARDCHMYATFQSHNQKVVQNRNGLFLSYLTEYQEGPARGRWVLVQSTDGGHSFRPIHSMEIIGAKPPAIETDEDDNLMLAGEDGTEPNHKLFYLRLQANDGYRRPLLTRLPIGSLSKFAMEYDAPTHAVYLFNHYGGLYVIDAATGAHRLTPVMHQDGAVAQTQYPHVCLDRDRVLHHAWTTQHKDKYLYWDIHYARSVDRGGTWSKADGSALRSPFIPDAAGPADQIILPDEFEAHTWLASMIVKGGKAHFAYRAHWDNPPMNRQHYVRLDLTTGVIDRNVHPEWAAGGVSINNQDGFFATRRDRPESPLCHVSRAKDDRIGALLSWDNGESWQALDAGDPVPQGRGIYSVGGCRELTPDGFIIGTFTMQEGQRGDVYFFKIETPAGGRLG